MKFVERQRKISFQLTDVLHTFPPSFTLVHTLLLDDTFFQSTVAASAW